jgi:lipoprotein-anchoring transpeptidase ErfK/SrfK
MTKTGGTKKIVVNLSRQVLYAYQSGEAIFTFDCVSGDEDHPTPTGTFRILRKKHPCMSMEYKVPMDHACFFTNRGHAIHQAYGVLPLSYLKSAGFDYFGSHGCIRLSEDDATTIYDWAEVGTPVSIQ